MFDFLRRMIVPVMMLALVGFLATIIFSWGRGLSPQQKGDQANIAGSVNGDEISWQEYNRTYDNLYQNEQQKTDDELSDAKKTELHTKAWNQLLFEHLMSQQIQKHNITVTDEELYQYLRYSPPVEFQQAPTFQTNGKFDYQKYLSALADPNYARLWAQYDPILRREIQKLKLQEMIIQTAHVTEDEVKEFYIAEQEKIKVGMVNVGYARFSSPPPKMTDEQLQDYFNAHKEDYTIKERAALNIVMIEKKPSPADWEAGYNRAKDIYDSIKAGADFEEMAKKYSEDGTAAQGGDLGWFPKGQMVEEFDKKVFNMKEGEVSEPIRTQFGWHIIKNYGFREDMEVPRGKTEKEKVKKVKASHILIKVTASQDTRDANYNRLQEFHDAAVKNGFLKAAKDLGFSVRSTSLFFRGRNIQYLGNDPAAGIFAFDHDVDAISPVYENSSAQYVVQVADKQPAGPATFEEVKDKVNQDLLKVTVANFCRDTANVIWGEIEKGTKIEKAAKDHGAKYETTDEFKRGQYVKVLSRDPYAIGAAFALENVGDLSGPVDYDQGTVILKLLDKVPADLTTFTAKRDSIYNAILISKQQELFGRWMESLRSNASIVNNVGELIAENRDF